MSDIKEVVVIGVTKQRSFMSCGCDDDGRDIRTGIVQSYAVATFATETIAGPVDGRKSDIEDDRC